LKHISILELNEAIDRADELLQLQENQSRDLGLGFLAFAFGKALEPVLFSRMTVRTIKSSPVAKKMLVKRATRAAAAIKSRPATARARKAARKSK
jgi:hypothetical protein